MDSNSVCIFEYTGWVDKCSVNLQTAQVITTSANNSEKQYSVEELWSDRLKEKLLRQSVHPILQARMYCVDNLSDYREFSKQELILTENLRVLCTLL
jgi:hypothetical protein